MKNKNCIYFGGIVGLLLLLTACSQSASGDEFIQEERITPVHIAEVSEGNMELERLITGTANPSQTTDIFPKASGELVQLSIQKGDVVEKGQIIGKLDTGSIQDNVELQEIAVRSARKQLEAAQVQESLAEQGVKNAEEQLNQAKTTTDTESDLNNAKIAIENAKIQVEQAQKNVERMEALYEQGAVSLSDLEQAQTTEKQAQFAYQQAENNYNKAENGDITSDVTSESTIAQAEIALENAKQQLESAKIQVEAAQIQVEQAETQLAQIQEQLVDTSIKATASGEITAVNVEAGDMVSNAQPLGTIISLDPIQINTTVSGEDLPLFEKGKEMQVHVKVLDLTTHATITYISPLTDESGLYLIEGEVDNNDQKIKPGMMMTYQLPTTIVDHAMLIPTEALVEEADGTYVYVVEDELAVKTPITVIRSQSDISAVSGEINVGDQVVTSGQITLSNGNKVTIIEEAVQ